VEGRKKSNLSIGFYYNPADFNVYLYNPDLKVEINY